MRSRAPRVGAVEKSPEVVGEPRGAEDLFDVATAWYPLLLSPRQTIGLCGSDPDSVMVESYLPGLREQEVGGQVRACLAPPPLQLSIIFADDRPVFLRIHEVAQE